MVIFFNLKYSRIYCIHVHNKYIHAYIIVRTHNNNAIHCINKLNKRICTYTMSLSNYYCLDNKCIYTYLL